MGTLRFYVERKEEAEESYVPKLADWECTQWKAWYLLFPAWSREALNLRVPSSPFPLYFLSPHLPSPPSLSLWAFPYCADWLSSGSFSGEKPHLCRSCEGWWFRLLNWHHWWVMMTILTGSTDSSFEALQLLQLEKKTKKGCSGNIVDVSPYIACEFLTNLCVGNPAAMLSDWSEVRKWWKWCHQKVFWCSTPLMSSPEVFSPPGESWNLKEKEENWLCFCSKC